MAFGVHPKALLLLFLDQLSPLNSLCGRPLISLHTLRTVVRFAVSVDQQGFDDLKVTFRWVLGLLIVWMIKSLLLFI